MMTTCLDQNGNANSINSPLPALNESIEPSELSCKNGRERTGEGHETSGAGKEIRSSG